MTMRLMVIMMVRVTLMISLMRNVILRMITRWICEEEERNGGDEVLYCSRKIIYFFPYVKKNRESNVLQ